MYVSAIFLPSLLGPNPGGSLASSAVAFHVSGGFGRELYHRIPLKIRAATVAKPAPAKRLIEASRFQVAGCLTTSLLDVFMVPAYFTNIFSSILLPKSCTWSRYARLAPLRNAYSLSIRLGVS